MKAFHAKSTSVSVALAGLPVLQRAAQRFAFLRRSGVWQSAILASFMIAAGGLDYMVNILAGRWLEPMDFGIFVSVTALNQILLSLSMAIRIVVASYVAELAVQADSAVRVSAFVRGAWRWSWRWGLVATAGAALVSPALAAVLRYPDAGPLWGACLMVFVVFTRQATYGALQGLQSFTALGLVQVFRAAARLLFAAGLLWAGWRAVGAILAQPLACLAGVGVTLWLLGPYLRQGGEDDSESVSWHYSTSTVVGLLVFGMLTNMDALFVQCFQDPLVAGNYGPVVTLARVSLFLPWAIGFVLLPKVTQRDATGQDPRPILLLSLAASMAPGLLLTPLYFFAPGALVRIIFTSAYADPGIVLGLAGLAATLYAGVNIWLIYALALRRSAYVYLLAAILTLQAAGMYALGRDSLIHMAMVMVAAGLLGNVAGYLSTWFRPHRQA